MVLERLKLRPDMMTLLWVTFPLKRHSRLLSTPRTQGKERESPAREFESQIIGRIKGEGNVARKAAAEAAAAASWVLARPLSAKRGTETVHGW